MEEAILKKNISCMDQITFNQSNVVQSPTIPYVFVQSAKSDDG